METKYCAFCSAEAIAIIERSNTPVCYTCMDVYECGQSNPCGAITIIEDIECGDTNVPNE